MSKKKLPYNLFLDDYRNPKDVTWVALPDVEWIIVKSYQEFVNIIDERGIPKLVSYDCDLVDEHYKFFFSLKEDYVLKYRDFEVKCGIECLEYLLSQCDIEGVKHPEAIIHTKNHYAEEYMRGMIKNFNQDLLKY